MGYVIFKEKWSIIQIDKIGEIIREKKLRAQNRLHFFASPLVVPRRMANPIIDSHVQIFSHAYSRQWPPVIVAALSTDAYKRTVCVTTQSKWFQFTILAAPIESFTKNKSHEITQILFGSCNASRYNLYFVCSFTNYAYNFNQSVPRKCTIW